MSERIPHETYFNHAMELNEAEHKLQEILLPNLPDMLVDAHVHSGGPQHYLPEDMTDTVYGHMMSTYPVSTIEMSKQIDETLLPGVEVRKVRFAHAFAGINHFDVTKYLLNESPEKDAVAVFGKSESPEDVKQTIATLRDDRTVGLKMYYLSSGTPKYELYSYFPHEVLKVAEEEKKPIILHLPLSIYKSHQEVVDLATEYPDLKIILAHLGVAHVPRETYGRILGSLATHPNVYADTAHVHNPQLVTEAIRSLGSDRILYGSDEPLNLLRAVIYDNPELGPRILADYPYHWVNADEYHRNIGRVKEDFVHSQWQQLGAIVNGIAQAGFSKSEQSKVKHQIFHENAEKIFDLQ